MPGLAVAYGRIAEVGGHITGSGYGYDYADELAIGIVFIGNVDDEVASIHGEVTKGALQAAVLQVGLAIVACDHVGATRVLATDLNGISEVVVRGICRRAVVVASGDDNGRIEHTLV